MTEVLVILDGASEPVRGDEPTSLERAATPVLDALAQLGTLRRLRTTPDGLPAGSETGCSVLLGWRPPGAVDRASLEAAARGIEVPAGAVARRVDVLSTTPPDAAPAPAPARSGRRDDERPNEDEPPAPIPAPRRADSATTALAADVILTAGQGAGLAVHRIGGHRLLLVGPPDSIGHALTTTTRTALAGAADLHVWPLGVPVARRLDGRTVVIGEPGAVTGLARLLGARVVEPDGFEGRPNEPVSPLADAALVELATGNAERIVIHVGAPDEAAHERNADLKVAAIEAVDEELLIPLAGALNELGGVLEIVIDHGCDPRDGRHHGGPTPALRWEPDAAATEDAAADGTGEAFASDDESRARPSDPRDIDPDAPGLHSGLDPEDLPVMALPKRRASASAQTGRRLTERWVRPLPIEEPAVRGGADPEPEPSP